MLDPAERAAIAGLPFRRSSEPSGEFELPPMPKEMGAGATHGGLFISKDIRRWVEIYDFAFKTDEMQFVGSPDRPQRPSTRAILHEIGHALGKKEMLDLRIGMIEHSLAARELWQEYMRQANDVPTGYRRRFQGMGADLNEIAEVSKRWTELAKTPAFATPAVMQRFSTRSARASASTTYGRSSSTRPRGGFSLCRSRPPTHLAEVFAFFESGQHLRVAVSAAGLARRRLWRSPRAECVRRLPRGAPTGTGPLPDRRRRPRANSGHAARGSGRATPRRFSVQVYELRGGAWEATAPPGQASATASYGGRRVDPVSRRRRRDPLPQLRSTTGTCCDDRLVARDQHQYASGCTPATISAAARPDFTAEEQQLLERAGPSPRLRHGRAGSRKGRCSRASAASRSAKRGGVGDRTGRQRLRRASASPTRAAASTRANPRRRRARGARARSGCRRNESRLEERERRVRPPRSATRVSHADPCRGAPDGGRPAEPHGRRDGLRPSRPRVET